MKSLLYMGGSLMLAASIYGFVDYTKSNEKNEVDNLYQNEGHLMRGLGLIEAAGSKAFLPIDESMQDIFLEDENSSPDSKTSETREKKLDMKFFSRGEISEELPLEKDH